LYAFDKDVKARKAGRKPYSENRQALRYVFCLKLLLGKSGRKLDISRAFYAVWETICFFSWSCVANGGRKEIIGCH
jgi:hypothetical protein